MKRCPECGHDRFIVPAHVVQDWIVDGDGEYIEAVDECVEVVHFPANDDIWYCEKCGYEAAGYMFDPDYPGVTNI